MFDYAGLAKEVKDPQSAYSKALAALRRVNPYGFHSDDGKKEYQRPTLEKRERLKEVTGDEGGGALGLGVTP